MSTPHYSSRRTRWKATVINTDVARPTIPTTAKVPDGVQMLTTQLQLNVPGGLQGWVSSLWYLSAGFMSAGALPMAVVAAAISWTAAIGGGAAICRPSPYGWVCGPPSTESLED